MTQEEIELLITDLCRRLSYGLIIKCSDGFRQSKEKLVSVDVGNGLINYDWLLTNIKPYLRPLSSMTDEEREEYGKVCELDTEILANHPINGEPFPALYNSQDWLNKKMFDYRGLIPRGLALEAKEGMYNN